jgi:hypothetical protein
MAELIEGTMILHNWLIDLEDHQEDVDLEPWMLVGFPPGVEGLRDVDGAKEVRDGLKDYLFNLYFSFYPFFCKNPNNAAFTFPCSSLAFA